MNKVEHEYILRNITCSDRSVKRDVALFSAWEDRKISSEEMYDMFMERHGIEKSRVSLRTVVEFAESLGYTGRNKYCGKFIRSV